MLEGWCHVLIMLAFSGYTSAPHLQIFRIYCALSLTLIFFLDNWSRENIFKADFLFQHSQRDFTQQGFKWALVLAIFFPSPLLAKSLESQGADDFQLPSRVWSHTIKRLVVIVFCGSWGFLTCEIYIQHMEGTNLEDWKLKLFLVPDGNPADFAGLFHTPLPFTG